ncbi:MAG: hypothetical protein ABH845_05210, partial [Candidatus Omnitrophota bacterium]
MQKTRGKPDLFVFCLILLLGFGVYADTLRSGFHFDDQVVIEENVAIRDLSRPGLLWQAFNTRFFLGLTFAFNYAVGKLDPFGYHLFNILIHLFSSFLVYRLVVLTFQTPQMKTHPLADRCLPLAGAAALFFLVHPIQTMAVSYIWQRGASLAAFFYLSAVVLYVQWRLTSRQLYFGGSLLATVLGMFTKEITFT